MPPFGAYVFPCGCGCGCGLDGATCAALGDALGLCAVCRRAAGAGQAAEGAFGVAYSVRYRVGGSDGGDVWEERTGDARVCGRACLYAFVEDADDRYCGLRLGGSARLRMRGLLTARLCARLWKARARLAACRRVAMMRAPLDRALAHRVALIALGRGL